MDFDADILLAVVGNVAVGVGFVATLAVLYAGYWISCVKIDEMRHNQKVKRETEDWTKPSI